MSKETEYLINKKDVFRECGIKKSKRVNCHHDYFRSDLKENLLPNNFPINSRTNLTPLPIEPHNELHWIVENDINYRDIDLRKYLANMAFNGELDLIPDRIYTSDPKDMMKR